MSDEIEHDKPDAITRLRAENERLRAALRNIYVTTRCDKTADKARAALEGK